MSRRREILNKMHKKRKSLYFLTPMYYDVNFINKKLIHPITERNDDKNFLIDVSFLVKGNDNTPKVVFSLENVDDETLTMDIYKLQLHHCFVEGDFGGENDEEVNIFLNIPKIWNEDFNKFIKGKYSEFSDAYKKHLTQIYGSSRASEKDGLGIDGLPAVHMYDVIYPTDEIRARFANVLGVNIKEIGHEIMEAPNIEIESWKSLKELEEVDKTR